MIERRDDHRLTHSRIQTAKMCLFKHFLFYELGLRPVIEAQPLRMGRVFHKGMELVGHVGPDQAEAAVLEAVADYDAGPPGELFGEEHHAWLIERETVATLLMGHIWRWREMNAGMRVVHNERVFEIPVRNPDTGRSSRTWTFAGKRDKIVELPGDPPRLAILEYKTVSRDIAPGSDFWPHLRLDSQISLYWLSALDEGLDIRTVIYDATRKPQFKPRSVPELDGECKKIVVDAEGTRVLKPNGSPRQSADKKRGWELLTRPESPGEFGERLRAALAEDPDHYFARKEIPRLDDDLTSAQQELWAYGRILRHCQRYGYWPRNTAACDPIGRGRCPCWELCTGGFDPRTDPVPEGWRQLDDVHPELVQEEASHAAR